MPHPERPREQALGGHRKIQVAPRDRQRRHQRARRIGQHRVGHLAPAHDAGLFVRQLPHAGTLPRLRSARRWVGGPRRGMLSLWEPMSRWEPMRLTGWRGSGWASSGLRPGQRPAVEALVGGARRAGGAADRGREVGHLRAGGAAADGPDRRRLAADRARGRSARPPALGRPARHRAELAAVGRAAGGGAAGRVPARHVRVPVARAAGQRRDPRDARAGRARSVRGRRGASDHRVGSRLPARLHDAGRAGGGARRAGPARADRDRGAPGPAGDHQAARPARSPDRARRLRPAQHPAVGSPGDDRPAEAAAARPARSPNGRARASSTRPPTPTRRRRATRSRRRASG